MFKKRIKMVILPMVMFVLFLVTSSLAQVEDMRPQEKDMNNQNAERWTQSLNNRLNMTEDQQTRINSILVDYQMRKNQLGTSTDATTLRKDVNRQIEAVLDDNQRSNWDAYSMTWWNEINNGTGTEFENRNNNQMERMPDDNQMERMPDDNQDMDTERDADIQTDDTEADDEDDK